MLEILKITITNINFRIILLVMLVFVIIYHYKQHLFQTQNQLSAHSAKAFVIYCMDFRLLDDVVYFLDKKGYNNNYDGFILAGASLGYIQKKYSYWKKIADQHIRLAKKLHKINEIIVIDHMDCGAYKLFYNKKNISTNEEIKLHKNNFKKFKKIMRKLYPNIKISTYLMNIDGNIIST